MRDRERLCGAPLELSELCAHCTRASALHPYRQQQRLRDYCLARMCHDASRIARLLGVALASRGFTSEQCQLRRKIRTRGEHDLAVCSLHLAERCVELWPRRAITDGDPGYRGQRERRRPVRALAHPFGNFGQARCRLERGVRSAPL
jgi:hypothetical protein